MPILENITLHRPLVFFDLETTGTNTAQDRIVELCAIKIHPDGKEERYVQRFNPGIPIPEGATAVHGITNAMVANEPKFRDEVKTIVGFFAGCDVAGYNIMKFDVPVLVEECLRAGYADDPFDGAQFVDSLTIYHTREPRNLAAALKFYAGETLENAHTAEADVEATIKVLSGQIAAYPDVAPTVEGLSQFIRDRGEVLDYDSRFVRNEEGEIVFNFGQNKGKRAADNPGMLEWIIAKDFSGHTKLIARKILQGTLR